MFGKTLFWPPIGHLHSQGRCKWWQGQWVLPVFGDVAFDVLLHARAEGPLADQYTACIALLNHAEALRQQATEPMVRLLQDGDVVPPHMVLNSDNVWLYLSPASLEVCDPSYYGDGDIAVCLGFAIPWAQEHLVWIIARNGCVFDELKVE